MVTHARFHLHAPLTLYYLVVGTAAASSLEDLCASQSFCNRTSAVIEPPASNQALLPCCLPCSCDADCVNTGNCCPDIGDVGPPVRPLECVLPVTNRDPQLLVEEILNQYSRRSIQRYQAVTVCPVGTTDADLIFRCEMKEAEYPEDLVMVADVYGHLFKNEFCAKCNGVSDITRWQLQLRCIDKDMVTSYTPSKPFVNYISCMFWSAPPDPDRYKGARCFASIDRCNQTGLWTAGSDDSYLVQMCDSVSQYYLHYDNDLNAFNVYKNPFCYKCNTDAGSRDPDQFCDYDGTDGLVSRNSAEFTAVLSRLLTTKMTTQEEGTSQACHEMEVYDQIFGHCRELFCPIFTLPWYGTCLQKYDKVSGTNIAVVFAANFSLADESQASFIYYQRMDILTAIEQATSLTDQNCQRCDISLWGKLEENQLLYDFKVIYKTTMDCDALFIQTALMNMKPFGNELHVQAEFGTARFVPSVLPGDADLPREGYESIPTSGGGSPECGQGLIIFRSTEQCPRLTFTDAEHRSLQKRDIMVPESHMITTDDENMSIRYDICLTEYQALTAASCPLGVSVAPLMIGVVASVTFS